MNYVNSSEDMRNNPDITVYDFENICRTCLAREDLKPLYEKCSRSTCLAEMLMACTVVKFTEDDGLPKKICTNCISEINQAFSFAKRCETTNIILRRCLKKITFNSSLSENVDLLEVNNEMKIEIKQEFILPDIYPNVQKVLEDNANVEGIKKIENVKIEREEYMIKEDANIDNENYEISNYSSNERCEKNDEDQNEIYSINSQIKVESLHLNEDSESYDDQDESASEKSDNSGLGRSKIAEEKWKEKLPEQIEKKIQCPDCNRKFSTNYLLRQHSINHGEKKFKCTVCDKCFVSQGRLNSHSKLHLDGRPYSCHECEKAFKTLDNLKSHKLTHTGKKSHFCSVCNKSFARTGDLNVHMRIHTDKEPHVCTICSKTFLHHCTFKYHMKLHTGVKPHVCSVCSKGFIQLSNYRDHMRIHSGDKPHVCSVCNKAFARSTNLKVHMRVHTREKPYVCSICSKAFLYAPGFKHHMRLHTGERPHVCSICNKAFTQIHNLKHHMRIHTAEKPFVCSICSKTFTQPHSLKYHMSTHIAAKTHVCSICSEAFSRKSHLQEHKKQHRQISIIKLLPISAPSDVI